MNRKEKMNRKEQIRSMIDSMGVFEVSKIIGLPVLDLVKYSDYSINIPTIIYEVIQEYFTEVKQRPGGRIYYKEFSIHYDEYEGVVVWNDGVYVDSHGGGESFEFYATPFWDGLSIIPINLTDVYVDNIDGDEPMSIIDEIDVENYYDYIDIDYKKFDSHDKLIKWLETDYLELTYNQIKKIRSKVINEY